MKNLIALCLLIFGLQWAWAAPSGDKVVVHLPAVAKVVGPQISLGDVADVFGENKALVDRVRRILLGRAALAGQKLNLTKAFVKISLRKNGFSLKEISVTGAETTEVLTQSQEFSTAKLVPELRSFILSQMNEKPGDVVVKLMDADKKIALPAGKVTYRFRPSFSGQYEGAVLMTVELEVDGREARVLPLRADVEVYRPVVVTKKRIEKGEKFTSENVSLIREPMNRVLPGCLQAVENVLGRTAAIPMAPGTQVRLNYIYDPPVIRQGQIVNAVVRKGNVEITISARAIENGKAGDIIRVENTDSHTVIRGKVLDENTVLIDATGP